MTAALLNRSEIMKAAWTHYRVTLHSWIKEPFSPAKFAWCLKCAWLRARETRMSEKDRLAASIRAEIDSLKYKSFQINIEPKRRVLESQLAAIAG